jgi:hypothetical protein
VVAANNEMNGVQKHERESILIYTGSNGIDASSMELLEIKKAIELILDIVLLLMR